MKFMCKKSKENNFATICVMANIGTGETGFLQLLEVKLNESNIDGLNAVVSNEFVFITVPKNNDCIEAVKTIYADFKERVKENLKADKIRRKASIEFNCIADKCEFDTIGELISWGDEYRFNRLYTIADLVSRAKLEYKYLMESDEREHLQKYASAIQRFIAKWQAYCEENNIMPNCKASEHYCNEEEAEEETPTIYKKGEIVTFDLIDSAMREHNKNVGRYEKQKLKAVIVYKQSNFTQEYSERSRSYLIDNNNHYFDNKISNALWGSCLDGTDQNVRLDYYNWDIEKCYFLQEVAF